MRLRSIISIVTIFAAASAMACSSSSNGSSSGGTPDAGGGDDGGGGGDAGDAGNGDGGVSAKLSFKPSNLDLSGIDISKIKDEQTSGNCEMRVGITSCFDSPAMGTVVQSDGSKVFVYIVKSWKVEPTAHVTLSTLGGNMPIAIVSLGDMTIMGTIDGHGNDTHASPGGFEDIEAQDGSGPGGGPKGTASFGSAGASYCGVGGKGSVVMGTGATPTNGKAATGTPEIVPLRGGASGGGGVSGQGGGGGAGLQLVADGAFSMSAGSYINVGGGGGGFGVTAGGGGAGGSILIEAKTVAMAGQLAANGGGGGGAGAGLDVGANGSADATAAAGGKGAAQGGSGSAGTTLDGSDAPAPTDNGIAGGGGGAAGRIRINTVSGKADLTGGAMSPDVSSLCVSQGTVK